MKKTLLFNIGNRHLKYRGQYLTERESELPEQESSIRERSRWLLENFETEKAMIETQIVDALVDPFKDEITEIVLIVTDQGKSSPHNGQDTLFAGEIVAKKLAEKYQLHSISIKKYEGNPTDLEAIFPYMTQLVTQYVHDGTLKIICNSGGTPQMKQALLLLATNLLPATEIEAWQVDPLSCQIHTTELSATIRTELVKRAVRELILHFDYAAAEKLVFDSNFEPAVNVYLLPLLQYGKSRLNFDFDYANAALNQLIEKLPALKRPEFEFFRIPELHRVEKILELHQNLLIQWQTGRFVSFLAWLFRLEEEIYYFFMEKRYHVDLSKDSIRRKFIEDLSEEIKSEVAKFEYKGREIRFSENSKPLWFFLLHIDPEYRKVTTRLNDIGNYLTESSSGLKKKLGKDSSGLDNLRNKSIAAHGFEGISQQKIEANYPAPIEKLFENLKFVISLVEKTADKDLKCFPGFYRLNEKLKQLLS